MPPAFILPDPLFQPQQRAPDADRDTAVDILCTAVAERRLTLAEPDEGVGAALSAALRYLVSRARRQGHGGSVHVQNPIICASLAPPA